MAKTRWKDNIIRDINEQGYSELGKYVRVHPDTRETTKGVFIVQFESWAFFERKRKILYCIEFIAEEDYFKKLIKAVCSTIELNNRLKIGSKRWNEHIEEMREKAKKDAIRKLRKFLKNFKTKSGLMKYLFYMAGFIEPRMGVVALYDSLRDELPDGTTFEDFLEML